MSPAALHASLVTLASVALGATVPQGSKGAANVSRPVTTSSHQSSAHPRRLLPVDQASKDPSLVAFRTALRKIVRTKNVPALIKILDPKIRNSFGGDGGIAEFKEQWKLGRQNSEVWSVLETILRMGGAFMGENGFCAPYVFARFPDDLDAFGSSVVIVADAPLLVEPHSGAAVKAHLSYAVVTTIDERKHGPWTHVEVGGTGEGYIRSELLRSPLDWRACFTKKHGRWVMDALIAGD